MRCLLSALVIFMIIFKKIETTSKLGKLKFRLSSKSSYSEEEKERINELPATSRLQNFENLPRTKKNRKMDLMDQPDIQNPPTSSAPMSNALQSYHAYKNQPSPAQTSYQNLAHQTPYPNTQLGLPSVELTELQKYQISQQHYGKYPPLLPRPENHGGTSGASGYGYQN